MREQEKETKQVVLYKFCFVQMPEMFSSASCLVIMYMACKADAEKLKLSVLSPSQFSREQKVTSFTSREVVDIEISSRIEGVRVESEDKLQVGSKGGSDRLCLSFIACCCYKMHCVT